MTAAVGGGPTVVAAVGDTLRAVTGQRLADDGRRLKGQMMVVVSGHWAANDPPMALLPVNTTGLDWKSPHKTGQCSQGTGSQQVGGVP
eukprot:CAMPEP_0174287322 /NCGR_PEP_ID=MMETSP0809-20121228/15467_1 /TAXON_ID=73025 ORGANISM="Eutreptiella gymnastica-like, Strain CCMP1594" /NCGR_SAMPLE_ID=MMETSP0809 /ASSEMBLY_ACC=CAM_ASM_000658 /LENGTH=87 /DNA_ID=CAMNT_0015383837 /DNA_START=120 /DNA_END=384 /DNA_ORIENTATION=-